MSMDFSDILGILEDSDFEEKPVEIEEFVTGEEYLNLPSTPLSDYQYQLIKASSQIYKRETLHFLYGFEAGERRWAETMNEVIFQLGKGSGKDFVSTIACAYIVYLLLCLKDPAGYYGKPPGDTIDIINVAVNATQANNVFFKGFVNRIERSPWFAGKWVKRQGEFSFDKNISVYSGHSEREAWEGYNVIFVVLDEISAFALDSTSGNEQAKTAESVYKMYRGSVTSRFGEFGKLVLLSFPRFRNDFIQQRYNSVIAEKNTITRNHTFKINPDLPDGYDDNEFSIEWEEDHIISYVSPKVFALKRPSWEVNPTKNLDVDYLRDFLDDPVDALSRFACMPPDAIDAFFKDRGKIERAFSRRNGVDNSIGRFDESFQPDENKKYFVHVDLARKHDHCAVALAHVDRWESRKIADKVTEPAPVIKVDAVRWWTPTSTQNVDFAEVREYIVTLRRKGFNIGLVTFDRWESYDMMDYLNQIGMKSERLSVAKKHYEDMAMVVMEERVYGPETIDKEGKNLIVEELLQLRIMPNDKVDHPRKGSKDLADAVCGAIYNAIAHTPRESNDIIDIVTLTSFNKVHRNMEVIEAAAQETQRAGQIIKAPKREVPEELRDYLASIRLI